MASKKLEFNVLNWDMSSNRAIMFNIFNNVRVRESVEKDVLDYLNDPESYSFEDIDGNVQYGYEAIKDRIDRIIRWQEWGRSEYEIEVGSFFSKEREKIDCYTQAHANIDLITKSCIDYFRGEMD